MWRYIRLYQGVGKEATIQQGGKSYVRGGIKVVGVRDTYSQVVALPHPSGRSLVKSLPSLCPTFFIYRMGMIGIPISQGCNEDWNRGCL